MNVELHVVVVVPTCELAVQILARLESSSDLCFNLVLSMKELLSMNKKDILSRTPSCLKDFIGWPKVLFLCGLKYMITDEADKMLINCWETEIQDYGRIVCGETVELLQR